jgi:hypothetical protein
VNRLGAPSVANPHICAVRDEIPGDTWTVRGRGDVERCVARIDVVMDRSEEVRLGVLAARSGADRTSCEIARCLEPSGRIRVIVRRDCTKESKQGSIG